MSVGCLVPNYSMASSSLADVGFTCAFVDLFLQLVWIFSSSYDVYFSSWCRFCLCLFFFPNVWVMFLSIGFAEVAEKAVHEEDAGVERIWQQSGSVHSTGIGGAVPKENDVL